MGSPMTNFATVCLAVVIIVHLLVAIGINK